MPGKTRFHHAEPKRDLFDKDFTWGIASSAAQTEGSINEEGKGLSIWDVFAQKRKRIANHDSPFIACDFYHVFRDDLKLIQKLGIKNFRLSISWSRIFPDGTGTVNQKGIDFYNRVFDACHELGIEPWVTLYHWDLPYELERKGGWTNREIIHWFGNYVTTCVNAFKDKVKNWMVLNEPMVYTGAGYFLGVHAPGRRGLKNFLPAMHHSVLCLANGTKIIRDLQKNAFIGSTFSCSYITPYSNSSLDLKAARRLDTLLNRLFIEPALGLGYPFKDLPFLDRVEKYMLPGDEQSMIADFDFIGIQNYTREVAAHSFYVPYIQAKLVPANKRKVYHTHMDWEVYPESIYEMIKQFSSYEKVKKIIVTENGASFPDVVNATKVNDDERIHYLKSYISEVHRAVKDKYPVFGYFVWSLTDNFEWTEGYRQRFGLIYINFETQQRIIKDSGYWYMNFLNS